MSSSAPEKVVACVKLARHRSVVVKVVASVLSVINREGRERVGLFLFLLWAADTRLFLTVSGSLARYGGESDKVRGRSLGREVFCRMLLLAYIPQGLVYPSKNAHARTYIYIYCRCTDKMI